MTWINLGIWSRSFHHMVESNYDNSWTTETVGLFPTPSHKFTVASMHLGEEILWTHALALPLTVYGTTPLSAVYQQSENLGCDGCDKDGGTALGAPQSLVPPPTHPSHHVSSWITNWRRRSPTWRANKHISRAQTEALLSLCLSPCPLITTGTNSRLIFWAVQGGLGCSLRGGRHLGRAGRSDSATPHSESIFTQWLWVWGRDGLSLGSRSHPPERGSWSRQPKRVLAAFWEHALFF